MLDDVVLAERIAERPSELLWLIADAIGLVPPLLLLRAIELPARGLSVTPVVAWSAAIGGTLGGALWLLMVSLAQRARGREPEISSRILFPHCRIPGSSLRDARNDIEKD